MVEAADRGMEGQGAWVRLAAVCCMRIAWWEGLRVITGA
jgi:hypothetical protein